MLMLFYKTGLFHLKLKYGLLFFTVILSFTSIFAQEAAKEEDFFKINKVRSPEGTILEVGGLCTLPNGDLAVTTRRGDIFIVENPTSAAPYFRKFASGLHEVLGVAYKNGSLYVAQRGELTRLYDSNMDGRADVFETVYAWPISGNYHEYSFGPKLAPDGSFFVTLNLGFPQTWWHPKSLVPWRGWTLHIFDDGRMEPWAAGMRSPCGISMIDGELFYTDNQGDWVGSGSIMPVKKGAFMGHPSSLVWANQPNSPVHVSQQEIFSVNSPRNDVDADGQPVKPENKVNEKFMAEFEMKKLIPSLQLPAVWLPHGILGISSAEIVKIPKDVFGPFQDQLLVGDQGQSKLMRVFMETVNGELQGCAWDFRAGFQSGIVRMSWAPDGSLFVGETNRGWGSAGDANAGLQRLVWNEKIPFEMRTVKARPDGFEIAFTKPVDKKIAADLASYAVESFIYKYHAVYGSPPVNTAKCTIKGVKVAADGLSVRLIVNNLREHYIHKLTLEGMRDKENAYSLVHPTGYYTLNSIPAGEKLALNTVSTLNTAGKTAAAALAKSGGNSAAAIKPLLVKYTCVACHNADKKQVGPSFKAIAQRNYSIEKILQLIKNPQPQNWPEYATPMAPMPQVPASDARRIAAYINSLSVKQ
jgi:cytochrome c551/c552/glucose/arabinose dehydrogenase